jgi:signal transduction histidine kinase
MGRMVSQLLDLTRARLGGGIPVERQRANLSEVVLAAVDELRLVHAARAISCSVPREVIGGWDVDRLAQVVSNLVGNAIQHGEPTLPVEVHLRHEGETATLTVRNQGAPIPRELLPVLFEPFRRGSRLTSDKTASGLGLGLYISEQITRAHEGAIAVQSQATATTFTVTLPIRPASPEPGAR